MDSRLDQLETRSTFHEEAIDALTRTSLAQQRTIEQLRAEIGYMKSLLQELTPAAVGAAADEPPPPHY